MSAGPRPDRQTCGEVLSYALRLANRNYQRAQIVEALLDDPTVRTLRAREARRFAERTVDKALERVARRPAARDRGAFVHEVNEIRQTADALPWPGRCGPTDRRVLEAVYEIAQDQRSTTPRLAARTWANVAGLPWQTVLRSKDRLVELRALSLAVRPCQAKSEAARYRLLPLSPADVSGALPGEELPGRMSGTIPTGHDAFRGSALGCGSWLIIRRLDPVQPVRADVLATVVGMHRTRTYNALGALAQRGLVRRAPDGWIRAGEELLELLDATAEHFGTAGELDRQIAKYAAQRREWKRPLPDTGPGRAAREPAQALRHEALDVAAAALLEPSVRAGVSA